MSIGLQIIRVEMKRRRKKGKKKAYDVIFGSLYIFVNY